MGALADKQFQSYRRVSPGKTVSRGSDLPGQELQEYAAAAVNPDGTAIATSTDQLLLEILLELKALRLGMAAAGICEEVELEDVA